MRNALYQMTIFSVILCDFQLPQTSLFFTFCIPLHIFIVGEDRDFKFGTQVDRRKSQPMVFGWQIIPERGVFRSREPFKFWWGPIIRNVRK